MRPGRPTPPSPPRSSPWPPSPPPPTPSEDGLVWDAYVFGIDTTQAAFSIGYDSADRTCHFLVGGVCPT